MKISLIVSTCVQSYIYKSFGGGVLLRGLCCHNGLSARTVTLRETKRCNIGTASASAICLCLSLHTICALVMFVHLFAFSSSRTARSAAQRRAHELFVVSPIDLESHSSLFPSQRPYTCRDPSMSSLFSRHKEGDKGRMYYVFRSVFILSLAVLPPPHQHHPGDCVSNFLTSISGRASSSETLVLSSLVRIATASSRSWMSTPFIWERERGE